MANSHTQGSSPLHSSYNTPLYGPLQRLQVLKTGLLPVTTPVSKSVWEQISVFENHLRVTRSRPERLLSNARSILSKFRAYTELNGLILSQKNAQEVVTGFFATFQHPAYRYTAIYYLRLFFDFLQWPDNPARAVSLPRVNPAQSRKFLEGEETQRLCALLERYTAEGKHLRESCLIHLILYTGLRAGEALALQWDDLNATGAVMVRDSKTHTSRMVYLPRHVQVLLQQYRQEQDASRGWVFVGHTTAQPISYARMRFVVKQLLREAGIDRPGVCLHSLRHTYARACVEGGLPREVIQQFLGHKDIETTAIYTRLLSQDVKNRSGEAHRAMQKFAQVHQSKQKIKKRKGTTT